MADDGPAATPPADAAPAPPAKKPRARGRAKPAEPTPPPAEAPAPEAPERPTAPKRATLHDEARRLLTVRRAQDRRRPVFGRQAANRYFRIGRDGAWRRPRGLQSKQRRHYGYRSQIVSIGYRSPARVRGLVPSGFRPVLVRTEADLDAIDGHAQAAVIARTVGTRRRIVLEEAARKLGIRVLNPIATGEAEA
jgi:large subunit ribosomal protein L32e